MLESAPRNLRLTRPIPATLGCENFREESKPIYDFTAFAGDLHAPLRSSFQRAIQVAQHLAA